MNTIVDVIKILTKEEKKSFVVYLGKKNKRRDTKNIELFKLLEANPGAQNIDEMLYGKRAKGAYHALSKRLFDSLIDFVATASFESEQSEEMEILKLLLVSRILFEKKVHKVAFKIIKKAELKAKEYELFGVLNEIYYTRIQYAHLDSKTSLEELTHVFEMNKKAFLQEEKLNIFYATIQNELLHNRKNLTEVVTNSLSLLDISIEDELSFRSLFKIVEINNNVANITRDFYGLLEFVERVNKQLEAKGKLLEKHLFYHIQILYYIANSHFRNRNFKLSENYLSRMEIEMRRQDGKYNHRFISQFTLLKALNFNYSGNATWAIQIITQFDFLKFKQQIAYVLDLKLSLVVFLFQQNRCEEALGLFKESVHSDTWYEDKAGIIWVIKKNLTEIMLHMELDNLDLVESRIKSFRKKHSAYLVANNEDRVLEFLSLAIQYYYKADSIEEVEFIKRIQKCVIKTKPEKEDLFVLSFYAWLKARVLKLNLYKTTLQVVTRFEKQ